VTNEIASLHVGNISWTHSRIYSNTINLAEDDLLTQPSITAPSIGWHVWHIARWADMLQASFSDQSEIWKETDLVSEFGLDPSKLGLLQMGTSLSHQDACAIPIAINKERLMDYAKTIFDLCDDAMADLMDEDLYTARKSILKIDFSTSPAVEGEGNDVLLNDDLAFHYGHANRHLGMIEALIGVMFNRSGTATI